MQYSSNDYALIQGSNGRNDISLILEHIRELLNNRTCAVHIVRVGLPFREGDAMARVIKPRGTRDQTSSTSWNRRLTHFGCLEHHEDQR
jgi:hypothetical protein